nr:DUF4304 domain-containing protein [Microbacterium sp.]
MGFGPSARTHGFKGSAPTWRKSNANGDWAIVNVQSSSWSTSERLRCVINISAAPEPWLRWERRRLGSRVPKLPSESAGLFRDRVHPAGTPPGVDGWWEVGAAPSAGLAVTDMIVQMDRAGWEVLDRLLTREGMLEAVRTGDLGLMKREHHAVFFSRAEALLLMDSGPSDELEHCLTTALNGVIPSQETNAQEFDRWVRCQAARERESSDTGRAEIT